MKCLSIQVVFDIPCPLVLAGECEKLVRGANERFIVRKDRKSNSCKTSRGRLAREDTVYNFMQLYRFYIPTQSRKSTV